MSFVIFPYCGFSVRRGKDDLNTSSVGWRFPLTRGVAAPRVPRLSPRSMSKQPEGGTFLLPLIYRLVTTRAVRFIPRWRGLCSTSKLTSVVLLGILVSVAEIGCTHYAVEPLPGSNLSRIVSPKDQVVCIGRWSADGPEGPWDFYESSGNQTALITFNRGVVDGPLRFYWGSLVVPSAAGKLQVTGMVRDGRFEQRWFRYAANGKLMNEAVYWDDEMITANSYSSEGAELSPGEAAARSVQLDNEDRRFLRLLLNIVHHAKPQRSR